MQLDSKAISNREAFVTKIIAQFNHYSKTQKNVDSKTIEDIKFISTVSSIGLK